MDKLGANVASVRPTMPDSGFARTPAARQGDPTAFREALTALQNPAIAKPTTAQPTSTLKFSNHAIDRMQSRGIRFSPEELGKIQGAVQKAAGKGSKDALLITDNAALIVSVKDNTVVTVMDKASLKDNVFTKIDSTVMI